MAKQDIHDVIVSILLEICKGYDVYKKAYRGNKKHRLAFAIPRSHGKPIAVQYEPDIIAEWRRGGYVTLKLLRICERAWLLHLIYKHMSTVLVHAIDAENKPLNKAALGNYGARMMQRLR